VAETIISVQQATPVGGGAESVLYTCPALTTFVASSLIICNTTGSPATVTVRIGVGGAGAATKQYILNGMALSANATMVIVAGITMSAGDVMAVNASIAGIAFSLSGVQET